MNKKSIALFVSRIFEVVIMYIGSVWIWNNFASPYNFWVVITLVCLYVLYFALTLSNDYWELTRGEGEPMI